LNKLHIVILFAASVALAFVPAAFCADLTGVVQGPNGPIAGVQVTVVNSGGNVVGQGTTNSSGTYCITGLDPGTYKTTCNAPAGLQPGATSSTIPPDGLNQCWWLSTAAAGATSANSPGTCGAGAAFLPAGAVIGGAALFVATGAGLGACAAAGCFSGSSSGAPSRPSTPAE
jgi:hypothetical protein